MLITPIDTASEQGRRQLAGLQARFHSADDRCREAVTGIIANVRENGDNALLQYTRQFDDPDFSKDRLRVTEQELAEAMAQVPPDLLATLDLAIDRIRSFHERERQQSLIVTGENGVITGRLVQPVDAAGLYVPGGQGGRTPLVSSVLMNGIPAAIAGVGRRIMVTPPGPGGKIHPALLVAAQKIGITEIYRTGSAWAIAGLAYGTATIAPVDVIVGPGNQYVTEAKRQVNGRVRIDMIAGPSEVLIIADETANPAYIAADMLAQAEHDPLALAILVTTHLDIAHETVYQLELQLKTLDRQSIARTSIRDHGVMLIVDDLHQAIGIANQIAAEHLELMVRNPFEWLPLIRHAGAIFLGNHTPEAVGDYVAGPNHVLPTMGTARYSSSLSVDTFIKKSSLISYSRAAFAADSAHIIRLAELEGLTAHAASIKVRLEEIKK